MCYDNWKESLKMKSQSYCININKERRCQASLAKIWSEQL